VLPQVYTVWQHRYLHRFNVYCFIVRARERSTMRVESKSQGPFKFHFALCKVIAVQHCTPAAPYQSRTDPLTSQRYAGPACDQNLQPEFCD